MVMAANAQGKHGLCPILWPVEPSLSSLGSTLASRHGLQQDPWNGPGKCPLGSHLSHAMHWKQRAAGGVIGIPEAELWPSLVNLEENQQISQACTLHVCMALSLTWIYHQD